MFRFSLNILFVISYSGMVFCTDESVSINPSLIGQITNPSPISVRGASTSLLTFNEIANAAYSFVSGTVMVDNSTQTGDTTYSIGINGQSHIGRDFTPTSQNPFTTAQEEVNFLNQNAELYTTTGLDPRYVGKASALGVEFELSQTQPGNSPIAELE